MTITAEQAATVCRIAETVGVDVLTLIVRAAELYERAVTLAACRGADSPCNWIHDAAVAQVAAVEVAERLTADRRRRRLTGREAWILETLAPERRPRRC